MILEQNNRLFSSILRFVITHSRLMRAYSVDWLKNKILLNEIQLLEKSYFTSVVELTNSSSSQTMNL
ncbi:hypothetical protein VNO78_14941 [Psophocarpus tetragonolobus]|uniref:Uncharacterized protein n=1 Tax=Psophocarpus tetragonolobus TaxID=3891 RepID=A0AAN9SD38_PSOTE